MWSQLIFERAIPVRSFAEIVSVDPHLAVPIHTVKLNEDQLRLCGRGDCERLSIPSQSTGQCSASCAGRIALAEFAFDTPVVWKVQLTPGRIAQIGVRAVRDSSEIEAAVLIARNSFPGSVICKAE